MVNLCKAILFSPLLFLSFFSLAQKSLGITVIVTDAQSSKPLTGATVTLASNKKQIVSDVDGKVQFEGLKSGKYSITASFVGFETKQVDDIEVTSASAQYTIINLSLSPASNTTLKGVVVRTDARRENLNTILNIRRNSAVVSDIISADMIRRSPDRNTSDVLKRISGTSIQENKFVLIRGMNDRYNEALLNGSLLPSSEPDRKTFAFDIFPSEIVDNITIVKSATPELPGSFAGGLVMVNTKEIPDKFFLNVKAGLGYNTIATGKSYYKYPGSSSDWLGYDNGTRKLPFANVSTGQYANYQSNDPLQAIKLAKSVPNNWGYQRHSSAPLFPAFQLTTGFNASKQNGYPKFGGIFGATYYSSFKFNEFDRYDYGAGITDTFYRYKDSIYTRNVLISLLANFTFKVNENNKFFFNNLFSVNSSDQLVLRSGPNFSNGFNDVRANSFFFVSNRIFNTQLGGEHVLPKAGFKIKWNTFYTNFSRDEPDYRRNFYFSSSPGDPYYALITFGTSVISNSGVHYYADVNDDSRGINLQFDKSFKLFKLPQTFRFGGAYLADFRSRNARLFTVAVPDAEHFKSEYLLYGQDSIYQKKNFNSRSGFTLLEDNTPNNHYDGFYKNTAAFAMFDNKLLKNLRFVWGLRYEKYHQLVHTFRSDTGDPILIDTTYNDLLPSGNLIFSVLPKANLRFTYSRTVARPLYRELANQVFFDFITNTTFSGNPLLTETHVNNYEVRWEHYFAGAQYYSISGFYKKFADPIEPYIQISGADSRTVSFKNVDKANNSGIEFEGRKNLSFINAALENFVIYANISFIKSKTTEYTSANDSVFRPLQGQSPYIINTALQYNTPKNDFGVSLLYNLIGPRLLLVGGLDQNPIYEKPHAVLDLKLNKTFLKKGIVELSFADILHQNDYQYWDINKSKFHSYSGSDVDRIIQRQNFGMTISLSVGYRF